jgi:hypothetical protein
MPFSLAFIGLAPILPVPCCTEIVRPRGQLKDLAPTGLGKGVEGLAELAIAIGEDKPGQMFMLDREMCTC